MLPHLHQARYLQASLFRRYLNYSIWADALLLICTDMKLSTVMGLPPIGSIDGWFISGKTPSFEMDDLGVPHDSGSLHIWALIIVGSQIKGAPCRAHFWGDVAGGSNHPMFCSTDHPQKVSWWCDSHIHIHTEYLIIWLFDYLIIWLFDYLICFDVSQVLHPRRRESRFGASCRYATCLVTGV